MQVQVSVTLDTKNLPADLAQLDKVVAALGGGTRVTHTSETPTLDALTKPAATKKAVAAAKAKAAEEEETEEQEAAAASDEDEGAFDLGGDEEATEEEEAPKVTQKEMLAALRAHPSKEKVTKLLQTKFKVKNVNQIKEAQYAEVIEAVKKLK